MNRRHYPLNALRAFEASARQLSFVKAAEELHVTPAAISHQVKKLEEFLGLQLFRRQAHGLLLSDAGQLLLAELTGVFQELDKVMERTLESENRGALNISVAPMFNTKWLVPRLEQFNALHPDIDIRISSNLAIVDLQRDGFDAAIRLGKGDYTGLESVKLCEEYVTPLCSPNLLKQGRPLKKPDDLRHYTLIHDDAMNFDADAPTWPSWLREAGASQVDVSRGIHFSHPDHALQAAIDGAGIVLGWRQLAMGDIDAGRLVQPFDLSLELGSTFYFVYPQGYANRTKILCFKKWLLNELG